MQKANDRSRRIFLSASNESLLRSAEDYIRGIAGDGLELPIVSDTRFGTISEDAADAGAEMIVLAVQADQDGRIDLETAFARVSLDSSVPVMVLRATGNGKISYAGPERLVVPVDGSSIAAQAVPLAERMAQVTGLPVRFVMVIDPSRVIPAAFAYDPDAYGIISELRQTAHWALRQAEEQLRAKGITADSDLLFGPVNACLGEIIGDGDVVVMTTHGSGSMGRRKFGSVAARILSSIPQPIVIMRASMQGDVVVDGYEACSWAEPLGPRPRVPARAD